MDDQLSEAGGAGADASASSGVGGADRYRDEMEATLQILRNREETLRVQGASLRAAELRLAEAARRDSRAHQRLATLQRELDKLRRQTTAPADASTFAQAAAAGADAAAAAELVDARADFDIVGGLYRNCFYEVAKQQDTIELLRKSFLDIRSMEDQKCRRIGELELELSSTLESTDKYQDIAVEVENLKSEIMSYLNSPNNDSGVWERCEDPLAAEVAEDLQDVLHQLLTLRDLLRSECSCGLAGENERLRAERGELHTQTTQLREKVDALEEVLSERSCCVRQLEDQIALQHRQVCQLQSQLAAHEDALRAAPASDAVDAFREQLQCAQECINTKTKELEKMRAACAAHDAAITRLEEELHKAGRVIRENSEVRGEVSQLSEQVRAWRARAHALESELDAARRRSHRLEHSYSEKAECAVRLRAELAEATSRGAELCEESHRVVWALRSWARRVRDARARQQRRLREQEDELRELRRLLAAHTAPRCACSRSDTVSARASQRTFKIDVDQRCGRRSAVTCSRSRSSSPESPHTSASASPLFCRTQTRHPGVHSLPRGESPAAVLMSRVQQLQAAWACGRGRRTRAQPRPHTTR